MDLDARDLHQAEKDDDADYRPDERWAQADIVAVHPAASPHPTVDIQEGGDTTVTIPNVRYGNHLTPGVGDSCFVLRRDEDRFVVLILA